MLENPSLVRYDRSTFPKTLAPVASNSSLKRVCGEEGENQRACCQPRVSFSDFSPLNSVYTVLPSEIDIISASISAACFLTTKELELYETGQYATGEGFWEDWSCRSALMKGFRTWVLL